MILRWANWRIQRRLQNIKLGTFNVLSFRMCNVVNFSMGIFKRDILFHYNRFYNIFLANIFFIFQTVF